MKGAVQQDFTASLSVDWTGLCKFHAVHVAHSATSRTPTHLRVKTHVGENGTNLFLQGWGAPMPLKVQL